MKPITITWKVKLGPVTVPVKVTIGWERMRDVLFHLLANTKDTHAREVISQMLAWLQAEQDR